MANLSIETHTRLIRDIKQAQIWLNLVIGLRGIKEIKHKKGIKQAQIELNQLIGLMIITFNEGLGEVLFWCSPFLV